MQHSLVEMAKKMHRSRAYISAPLVKGDAPASAFVKDIEKYPHAFVMACLMDPQGNNENAWTIPYKVYKTLGTFEIKKLYDTPYKKYMEVFEKEKFDARPLRQAKILHAALHKIVETPFMNGDASNIWNDRPNSADVVRRFLEFDGCGFNIANTAPILLWRFFGVDFSDYGSIDLPPEEHVVRIFQRMGLIPYVKDKETAHIYVVCKARELNPSFPGLIDGVCWNVGKKYCRVRKPLCDKCPCGTFCENVPDIDAWTGFAPGSSSRHIG